MPTNSYRNFNIKLLQNKKNDCNISNKFYIYLLIMVDSKDLIMWYWVYRNVLHNEKNNPESDNYEEDNNDDYEDRERQEEIEDIMDEYWVDEDEAEEILDSM